MAKDKISTLQDNREKCIAKINRLYKKRGEIFLDLDSNLKKIELAEIEKSSIENSLEIAL